ncbi:MAG: M15 family metallopeptidase [Myxococcales bacterium]|nr:M15 family metallopeptidase [Myxococcales bacterium]
MRYSLLFLLMAGCGVVELDEEYEPESNGADVPVGTLRQALVECNERQATGYRSGSAFTITLVTADGKPIEKATASAYGLMQAAAARQGVNIYINSGFRTQAEQQYFYSCYTNCNCNSCNLAARPGYSNHQSGSALDLNTANTAVFNWLNANAATFGFRRTVPSEAWHWEYFGGAPAGGPCSAPPPCDRTAGPFTFSCDGPQSGQTCVNLADPGETHSWSDNYLCTAANLGLRYSWKDPIAEMNCVNTAEPAEENPDVWADNFFCAPKQTPWRFSWSSAGALANRTCVHWNEPTDRFSWSDNFLCAEPVMSFSNAGFTFSMSGPAAGHCVNVVEPADPDMWNDNFFCSDVDVGMRWSNAGPIAGMRCENVAEGAEARAAIWADNWLCVPEFSSTRFRWSSAGPIAGLPCVRWFEHSETSTTWLDNWMCIDSVPLPLQTSAQVRFSFPTVTAPGSSTPGGTGEVELESIEAVSGGCTAAPLSFPLLGVMVLALRRRRR